MLLNTLDLRLRTGDFHPRHRLSAQSARSALFEHLLPVVGRRNPIDLKRLSCRELLWSSPQPHEPAALSSFGPATESAPGERIVVLSAHPRRPAGDVKGAAIAMDATNGLIYRFVSPCNSTRVSAMFDRDCRVVSGEKVMLFECSLSVDRQHIYHQRKLQHSWSVCGSWVAHRPCAVCSKFRRAVGVFDFAQ